jgi:membrane protein required for colicin V production
LILILLAIGAYSGYKQGLFVGLLSIVAFFIGIVFAFKFMHWGAERLAENVESLTFMLPFVSFISILLVVTVVIRILAFMVKKALDLTILGTFDNFAGAILGLLKWAVMISLLFWVAESFEYRVPNNMTKNSIIYPAVTPIAPAMVAVLDDYTPIIDQSIAAIKELVKSN